MDKAHVAWTWLKTNWPWLSPIVLGVCANLYNGLSKYPTAKSWMKWVIDMLSLVSKSDSDGTFKLPFKSSKAPAGKPNMRTGKPASVPAVVASLLIAFMLLNTGCACWKPEGKNDPKCIVLREVVDCTTGALKDLGPALGGVLAVLMSGNTEIDWNVILDRLKGAGLTDAGCILAELQKDFMGKPAASPQYTAKMKVVQDVFTGWKVKNKMSGVKFKVLNADKKEVLL